MFRRLRNVEFLSRSGSNQSGVRKGPRRRQRAASRNHLQFESLEMRCLLSATPLSTSLDGLDVGYSPLYAGEGTEPPEGDPPPFELSETFLLNSNPDSTKTIYLDFNGHTTTDTMWNESYGEVIESSPWDFDGNIGFFSDVEKAQIQGIWERVVEDFRPFDVNVTTEDPGVDALQNLGGDDEEWGIRVVITTENFLGAGGVAFLNSFDWDTDTPAFSFNPGERVAAMTISHEVGHTFGLRHDGNSFEEYYPGHGSGATSWGAIMGAPFDSYVNQWSWGDYPDANNQENDLELINSYVDYLPDDHGNSIPSTTSELTVVDGIATGQGVIGEPQENSTDNYVGDVDYISFTTDAGIVEFDVSPFYRGANLDIGASLYDSEGRLLASSAPENELGAWFSAGVAAGTYYVAIEGTGREAVAGDPGYSNYGSLGFYSITATLPSPTKGVDLLTTFMEVAPDVSLGISAVTTVDFWTVNEGDVAADEFDVSFYLSDDELIDPASDVLLTIHPFDSNYDESQPGIYTVTGGLAPGAGVFDSVVLAVPGGDPFATDDMYYIGAVADVNDVVLEADESNNHSIGVGRDLQDVRFRSVVQSFELDNQPSGWTTEGEWEFGTPTGQGGEIFGNPDPFEGATGTNVFGVDLNGNYDLFAGGPWYLTTAPLDFTGFNNVILEFQRLLNIDFRDHVFATIEVSNDGENWTNVFANPESEPITDFEWQTVQYDISAVADNQPEVYVRWGYEVNVDAFAYSGWNIDDIVFLGAPLQDVLGEIQGTVWGDVNADSVRDTEDLGLEGWTVFLDENNNSVLDGDSKSIDSTDVPTTIEDENTVTSNLTVSTVIGTIDSLTVNLDITHGNPSELDVYLISPAGTMVELPGGVGGPLSGFDGEDPTGLWMLEITDNQAGDTGTLDSWSLDFETSERSTLSNADGEYTLTDLPTDFYKVFTELQAGWTQTVPMGMDFQNAAVGPGQVVTGNDFAFNTNTNVSGVLWHDEDGDGEIDGGESFLQDQIVYVDENGNGERDVHYMDFQSTDVPVDIPDLDTVESTIFVEDAGQMLADLNVTLDISHTFDGDLEVYLMSPTGTLVELFSDVGTIGTGFSGTTLDDDAETLITEGTMPYTGTFRPLGSLGDFIEEDPNGLWTLRITDDQEGDVGSLNSWSLSIGTSELFAVTDSNGEYSFDTILPGEYDFRQILQDGWEQTYPLTPAQTVILAPESTVADVNFGSREAPSADFDEDEMITGLDFLTLQRGYGSSGSHADGDADGNGMVEGMDVVIWEEQYVEVTTVETVVEEESTGEETGQSDTLALPAEIAFASDNAAADRPSTIVAQYDSSHILDNPRIGSATVPTTAFVASSSNGVDSSQATATATTAVAGPIPPSVGNSFGRELFAFAPLSSLMNGPSLFRLFDSFDHIANSTDDLDSELVSERLSQSLAGAFESVTAIDEFFGDADETNFRVGSDVADESDWLVAVADGPADDELWGDWL